MRVLYLASAGEDFRIVEVEVIKETEKQFALNERKFKTIHGSWYYVPSRLRKDDPNYHRFETLGEARLWCLETMKATATALEKRLEKTRSKIAELEGQVVMEYLGGFNGER